MGLLDRLMMDCEQATFLIAKSQETELSGSEKLKLRMHLLACKYCRLFKTESDFIDGNISHMMKDHNNEKSLSPELKKGLQDIIDTESLD